MTFHAVSQAAKEYSKYRSGNERNVMFVVFTDEAGSDVKDPQFGLDVGFYAFDLPFYRMVLDWLFVAVVIAFFASLVTHYVFGGLRLTGREGTLTRREQTEINNYERAGHVLNILQSKARRSLKSRRGANGKSH